MLFKADARLERTLAAFQQSRASNHWQSFEIRIAIVIGLNCRDNVIFKTDVRQERTLAGFYSLLFLK